MGYLHAEQSEECFRLLDRIEAAPDVAPTQVTFGILLDACIGESTVERTQEVFDRMMKSGIRMNTVLYATLIKGVAKAEKKDKALHVFEQMQDQSVERDCVTYSILVKALCDAGVVEQGLLLLGKMIEDEHAPDESIFNNLPAGAVVAGSSLLAEKLLEDMRSLFLVQPSNATFSFVIKATSSCAPGSAGRPVRPTSCWSSGSGSRSNRRTRR